MDQIRSQHTVFVFALNTGKMVSVGKLSTVNTTVLGLCKLRCKRKNMHMVHRLKDSRSVKGVKINTESLKSNPNITSQEEIPRAHFPCHQKLFQESPPNQIHKDPQPCPIACVMAFSQHLSTWTNALCQSL
jgi:hypothetical protein